MLAKYLPSKKFLYTVVAIIIVLVLVILAKNISGPQKTDLTRTSATRELARQTLEIDTDGDGLKDWEEALWKTDKGMADTDGDKTSDYEEVKVNRDPTKKGPGDEFDAALVAKSKKEIEDFKNLTLTEQLSQTLFSQYIAAKGEGTLSQTNKQVILDTAVSGIINSETNKYSISDIKMSPDRSISAKRLYGDKLGSSFFAGTNDTNVENELVIIDRAINSFDETELKKLTPIIESYEKTISLILTIDVPYDAIDIHLNMLNDLRQIKAGLENIQKIFTDPALAIVGMGEYQNGSYHIIETMMSIKNYFAAQGIVYTDKEPGYIVANTL